MNLLASICLSKGILRLSLRTGYTKEKPLFNLYFFIVSIGQIECAYGNSNAYLDLVKAHFLGIFRLRAKTAIRLLNFLQGFKNS